MAGANKKECFTVQATTTRSVLGEQRATIDTRKVLSRLLIYGRRPARAPGRGNHPCKPAPPMERLGPICINYGALLSSPESYRRHMP